MTDDDDGGGVGDDDARAATATTTAADAATGGRRRSRWGADDAPTTEMKKRRKSRWATEEANDDDANALVVSAAREAKERADAAQRAVQTTTPTNSLVIGSGIFVQLPTSVLAEHSAPAEATAEVHFMFRELAQLNRRLLAGEPYDEGRNGDREPEPAPVYDANGVRVNTREVVEREKFQYRRMELLEDICRKCPTFRPPPDYRPNKRTAKLLIPVDEYPGYNFFGLIIGPRGSTQKQMQRETNTKIVIRGRGSAKGGTGAAERNNEFDHEPLHVLIEGDVQSDVDKAKAMIEKLLIPVDEDMNDHKRQQLRELALMNGTWRDESSIEAMQKRLDEELASGSMYQLPETVKKAVEATYRKDVEKLHGAGAGGTLDSAYSDFLSELGVDGRGRARRSDDNSDDDRKIYVGHLPNDATADALADTFKSIGGVQDVACIPDTALGYSCKGFAFITFATAEQAKSAATSMNGALFGDRPMEVRLKTAPREESRRETGSFDPDANLYVGGMTESMTEESLREIFAPYGLVQKTKLIRDHATQVPKGYGFVQMMDVSHAHAAIAALDGQYFADSTRPFIVRIAGQNGGGPTSGGGGAMGGFAPMGFAPPIAAGGFMPPAYGFQPAFDPVMAASYYGAPPVGAPYDFSMPTVELGNPDEAPPPPPDDFDAPPLPVLTADAIAVLPGVAPPMPPPPKSGL